MLRINQNNSASRAKSYFRLSEYYSEGQELEGTWRGKGAERLGLSGGISKGAWDAICDNRNPATGEKLTPRQKSDRRVGYDFNFHVPKSVSLLYGLTNDPRILDAARDSVNDTMVEMEREMKTRVRRGGRNEERTTGEMIWGEYVHFTSRPIGGIPDPHLHAHCFVLNTTFDEKEGRWKAASFADLKRDAPYFEAGFHSRMASRMAALGLPIVRTQQGWEIAGISEATLKKFSRRTALIEELARSMGITDAADKSELGAKTRERKQKHLNMTELRQEWRARLTDGERSDIDRVQRSIGDVQQNVDPECASRAAKLGVEHCFERKSVVPERILLAEAIKRGIGVASADAIEAAVLDQGVIVGEKQGRRFATTKRVLGEEQRMIDFARSGRGACEPLAHGTRIFNRDWLNDGQRRAVQHVLDSRDRVILVRGVAGTGKTTMMSEAVEGIKAGGKQVFTFAPSADASRGVLRESGFSDADTVARLLKDETLQEKIRGQVIWIDEASLLGSGPMRNVFDLADRLDARIVLSGDRRQHGSVDRGAALRLLETEAGLVPAEIKEIQRQQGAYKQAVQALSEGRTEMGLKQLDAVGWIKEAPDDERYKLLAHDYVDTVKRGKSALVVSPTHREGETVTDEIRAELRKAGKLSLEQRSFRTLQNANLTAAQRADAIQYRPGDVLVFHQNAKGFSRGERVEVGGKALPLEQADRFTLFRPGVLPLSRGDVIRVTQNGKTAEGEHRLNNGALFTVKEFTDEGDICLTNGWVIGKDFGHLAHGYAVTSQASQGKTVDQVLIGISSASFPAASREGFYVAASRGREMARIYTDDKHSLLEAVARADDRLSATEFMADRARDEIRRRMDRHRQAEHDARIPARDLEGMTYER
jgi:conjugative relaxase-like TrwC/TraI family protein